MDLHVWKYLASTMAHNVLPPRLTAISVAPLLYTDNCEHKVVVSLTLFLVTGSNPTHDVCLSMNLSPHTKLFIVALNRWIIAETTVSIRPCHGEGLRHGVEKWLCEDIGGQCEGGWCPGVFQDNVYLLKF